MASIARGSFGGFLRRIERAGLADLEIDLVLDNYATHKTATVASWLNQVERWLAKIIGEHIHRGVFKILDELIAEHNRHAEPSVWTASAELILDRIAALCPRTNLSPHERSVTLRSATRSTRDEDLG